MWLAQLTVRDALNSALDEELARDDNVFLLGEEVWFTARATARHSTKAAFPLSQLTCYYLAGR